ncbi:MAG: hypothetical protein ACXVNF_06030 [Neobacillus sp.]
MTEKAGSPKERENPVQHRLERDLSYEEVKALIDYYRNHPYNLGLLTLLATTEVPDKFLKLR